MKGGSLGEVGMKTTYQYFQYCFHSPQLHFSLEIFLLHKAMETSQINCRARLKCILGEGWIGEKKNRSHHKMRIRKHISSTVFPRQSPTEFWLYVEFGLIHSKGYQRNHRQSNQMRAPGLVYIISGSFTSPYRWISADVMK